VTGPIRTGIWLFPDAPAPRFVEALVAVEDAGVDEVWVGDEGPGRDPIGLLAAVGRETSRLRLGVGVTNPYGRHPAITATAMATVHELSGGRAVLGLGPGGRLALDPLGVQPQHPLTDCRRALAIMRAALTGTPADGYEPPSHAFLAPDLPIYIGARGERFNRWASAEADGVFLAGIAPSLIPDAVGWARSVRSVDVALYLSAALDDATIEEVRPRLIHAFADAPARLRALAGLDDADVARAAVALADGDPDPASALLTDDVLDLVLARGERATVKRAVALARAHGPDSIGLVVLGADPLAEVERAAAALARVTKELT
jgi:5,10-methylenetetrahydromethanopterin reductase